MNRSERLEDYLPESQTSATSSGTADVPHRSSSKRLRPGPESDTAVIVEFAFDDPPAKALESLPDVIYGGIRVTIDGLELTAYRNEPRWNEEDRALLDDWATYDYTGTDLETDPHDFHGDRLNKTLSGLYEAVTELADPEDPAEGYLRVPVVQSVLSGTAIEFANPDGTEVTVSYRSVEDTARDEFPVPTGDAKVGERVAVSDLCTGLARAFEGLLVYLDAAREASLTDEQRENATAKIEDTEAKVARLRELADVDRGEDLLRAPIF